MNKKKKKTIKERKIELNLPDILTRGQHLKLWTSTTRNDISIVSIDKKVGSYGAIVLSKTSVKKLVKVLNKFLERVDEK